MIPYAFDYIWINLTANKKWQGGLKWIATAFVVFSAIVITIFPTSGLHIYPFVCFLTGHIIWAIFATLMKEWSLFFLNFCFIIIDAAGVVIRI